MTEPETTRAEKDYMAAQAENITEAMAQAEAAIAQANGSLCAMCGCREAAEHTPGCLMAGKPHVDPGHNHTDRWPCNASCPAHPDFAKAGESRADVSDFDVALELTSQLEKVKADMAAKDARIAELENRLTIFRDKAMIMISKFLAIL